MCTIRSITTSCRELPHVTDLDGMVEVVVSGCHAAIVVMSKLSCRWWVELDGHLWALPVYSSCLLQPLFLDHSSHACKYFIYCTFSQLEHYIFAASDFLQSNPASPLLFLYGPSCTSLSPRFNQIVRDAVWCLRHGAGYPP